MDLQLTNRHVLITGGSKGIGLACAQAFLDEGARVTLIARQPETLARAQDQLTQNHPADRVHTLSADLVDAAAAAQAVNDAVAHHGPIDVLVNSAGAAKRTPPHELTISAWHDAMDAKYFSYLHVLDPVIKRMVEQGHGAVVNIIGAGGKVASPVHLPGGAANAALMLVTVGMANAMASKGVRVNALNPGATVTERLQEGLRAEARLQGISEDQALQNATARIPMGRMAQPEEVAHAAVFLASAKASYLTGVVMAMDGATHPIVV
jgi:NAD(P)-dependent dehydrogenase (short-subunit alcohol dehydrogenase family)